MRDASNTGYIPLVQHAGNLVIDQAATVIDGLDIHGYVTIKAPFVTIRRCIIRGGTPTTSGSNGLLNVVHTGAGGYLVEDVTLKPEHPNVRGDGIKVNQAGKFRRIDLSGTVDGIVMYGDGITVEDSYLHDFVQYATDPAQHNGPSHNDAIAVQAGRGITIRGNTIRGANNSAVIITQDAGTVGDLQLDDNDIDGGAASINIVTNGAPLSNIKMRRNRFGRGQRIPGAAIMRNPKHCQPDTTGSVWADTGEPIIPKLGA